MNFKNLDYQDAKKRLMQLYIVGEGLRLIGAVVALNVLVHSKIMIFCGIAIFILGTLLFLLGSGFRCSKGYRKLKREDAEVESIKDIAGEFGIAMTILGLLFIFAIVFMGIYFAYQWTHSWIKVVLFLIAFSFVDDLKEYYSIDDEEEVE